VHRSGWKLVYDPLVAVDHYPALRFDADQRDRFDPSAWVDKVHNETLILLEHLPAARRVAYLAWSLLIGTRSYRGLLQCLRFLPQEQMLSVQKWLAALQGRWCGWQSWRQSLQDTASKDKSEEKDRLVCPVSHPGEIGPSSRSAASPNNGYRVYRVRLTPSSAVQSPSIPLNKGNLKPFWVRFSPFYRG
jgi:hypothetical protein